MSAEATPFRTESECRSCGSARLETVLDLGRQPLANALRRPDRLAEAELRVPLTLAVCAGCSLAQIRETVPPETLFREYVYFSSYSETMLAHAREVADELVRSRRLGPRSLVVEVASNDGYQLRFFRDAGVPVLGIEPARNVAAVAEERGIPTRADFFGRELASELARGGRRADLILANNVLAHVPDLNGVLAGFAELLAPGGVAIVEVPYVRHLLDRREFDTIYHEHLAYFSLTALERAFARQDLRVVRVEELPIHGGSLRVFAERAGGGEPDGTVAAMLADERARGLDGPAAFAGFQARVDALGARLRDVLRGLKARGARIAAYGAAAKGSTLLNTFRIGLETLDFVVDRNPRKQGLCMPGVHLPISPPERLLGDRPDACLLLAWNLADEVLRQQSAYRAAGGKFILPVPDAAVV